MLHSVFEQYEVSSGHQVVILRQCFFEQLTHGRPAGNGQVLAFPYPLSKMTIQQRVYENLIFICIFKSYRKTKGLSIKYNN